MSNLKRKAIRAISSIFRRMLNQIEIELGTTFLQNDAVNQKILMQQYRLLASRASDSLPSLDEVGFRRFSQFEEDGILLYFFSLVSPINRRCVEICAGNGRENMTTNLIVNHGWWGFLFDGNPHSVEAGNRFFTRNKDTFFHPPVFKNAWVSAENVNDLLVKSGISGPIDLLSLDMDGVDYWIWKAITVIQPRVVVCETHNIIPADKALTVPYKSDFVAENEYFRSVSLAAMCKLGKEKGYRLVGTHRFGFNAFFMQNGVGDKFFPEVTPESCLDDPVSRELRERLWPSVQKYPWQAV
jgi:hypothetical protein